MATTFYLAMTEEEFNTVCDVPPKTAWFSCHFSPHGNDLSNFPATLPPDSLLIINDQIPICGHDPFIITRQLQQIVARLECSGILLDFQRPGIPELNALSSQLVSSLPCLVAVSELYAKNIECPVFLSPCPHHVYLRNHIMPWSGRELWLDLALDAEIITVTPSGSAISSSPLTMIPSEGHCDNALHCHYKTETEDNIVRFTLWRTKEDMNDLIKEAASLGIRTCVGLYQEWK